MEDFKTVYRVVGRRNEKDAKPFILAGALGHPLKTLDEAKRIMNEIIERNKREVSRGKSITPAGCFSVECELTNKDLLVDVHIQSRKVTPWVDEKFKKGT